MSLIRTETRDTKRAADPLHDLRSKPFSEWGEDEIRRFNLIDALLEFVYTDTSSPFGIGMTFDYTECWEIGVRDDCLVMTRVKPVHPEYAKHWNMKGVMNDKTRFHADKWVGYSKVLAWVSLSHKDTFTGAKRFQYFQTMYDMERQINANLPVGGLPNVDTERTGKLFQRDDFSEDSHANDPKLVGDDYVPQAPEQSTEFSDKRARSRRQRQDWRSFPRSYAKNPSQLPCKFSRFHVHAPKIKAQAVSNLPGPFSQSPLTLYHPSFRFQVGD